MTAADAAPLFVCGAFRNSSGLAQSARLYVQRQQRQGVHVLMVDITAAMLQRRDFTPAEEPLDLEQILNKRGCGTVVIHANPPQFHLVLCKLGKDFLRGKRLIGYWAWELETIPDIWRQALQYVDEVETPSTFVQRALQGHTDKKSASFPTMCRNRHGARLSMPRTAYCAACSCSTRLLPLSAKILWRH